MYVTSAPVKPDIDYCSTHRRQTRVLPDRRVAAGHHVFREGDPVRQVYQVKTGVVRLARLLEDGRRQVIAFGYPGDIVGFPSLGLYHSDCDALTNTVLHPYRREVLEDGGGDPELHRFLLDAALNEISAMQDHFMMLGRKSAFEKVASFLAVLSARVGVDVAGYRQVDLPMTRGDIGDFLGLTTETVSRTFTQLRKAGVIEIDHVNSVIVLRPESLVSMAASAAS